MDICAHLNAALDHIVVIVTAGFDETVPAKAVGQIDIGTLLQHTGRTQTSTHQPPIMVVVSDRYIRRAMLRILCAWDQSGC